MYLSVYLLPKGTILDGRGDWSNEGCSNATMNEELRNQDVVICRCNHLSTFGIFVVHCGNESFVTILCESCIEHLLQNTDPLVCKPGFMANPSLTDCTGSDNINIKSYHFLITLLLSSH